MKIYRQFLALLALEGALHAADRVILTSPRGTFQIVQAEEELDREWVVVAKDRTQRTALGGAHDAQPHTYYVSPDERWIFAHVHMGSGMGAAKLLQRGEGVQFQPFRGGEGWLDDPVWRFCRRASRSKPRNSGIVGPGDEGIIDFVAWSPDSARVLLALRAGEKRGKGIYMWHAYLNVRTGKLELTDYLRAVNRDAARRWEDDELRAHWARPASAEPLDPLPPEAELQRRGEVADERLNQLYAKAMQAAKDDVKKMLRDEQRNWLVERAAGAKAYAAAGPKAEQSQRRRQFFVDATEARNRELELVVDYLRPAAQSALRLARSSTLPLFFSSWAACRSSPAWRYRLTRRLRTLLALVTSK